MIIYKAQNIINGKVYIGKTIQLLKYRKNRHLVEARNGSNFYIHASIRKYGQENFTWAIIAQCKKEDGCSMEQFYIKKFNCMAPVGLNLTCGGEGALGCIRSNKAKRKWRLIKENDGRIKKIYFRETRGRPLK